MPDPQKPEDIVEFSHSEGGPLKHGEWHWRVVENKRSPVVKCHTCGNEMHFPARFTIASDGLIGSVGGRGFRCSGYPKGCTVVGRFMLVGYREHRGMVD